MMQAGRLTRPKVSIRGARGQWYATVDDEQLPCVHQHWVRMRDGTMHYDDGEIAEIATDSQVLDLVDRLRRTGKAVITLDAYHADRPPGKSRFERKPNGYVGVFSIDQNSVVLDERGLRFRFVDRLADSQ
jgi:hypothetical protein